MPNVQVKNVVQLNHDQLPLDAASRICNSELLSKVHARRVNAAPRHAGRFRASCDDACRHPLDVIFAWTLLLCEAQTSAKPRGPSTPKYSTRTVVGSSQSCALARPRVVECSAARAFEQGDQLIVFAFHDSNTLRETIEEAKAMSLLVTVLFLD